MAESGAISLGFSTTVQPTPRAGATLRVIWFIGQFQGVIRPQTPIGSCTRTSPLGPMGCSNWKVLRASTVACMSPRPASAWAARAMEIGAPISSEMALATSSMRRS